MARIIVWFILLPGGLIAAITLDLHFFRTVFSSLSFHIVSSLFGLMLLRLVVNASRKTGRLLAREGRVGKLPRMETNRLVTTGIYGCMRHPMHLGLLFFPLAVGLVAGSPSFILLFAPLEAFFILVMLKFYEEPEAIRKFGDEYRAYQRRVPMFDFSVECLRELFLRRE